MSGRERSTGKEEREGEGGAGRKGPAWSEVVAGGDSGGRRPANSGGSSGGGGDDGSSGALDQASPDPDRAERLDAGARAARARPRVPAAVLGPGRAGTGPRWAAGGGRAAGRRGSAWLAARVAGGGGWMKGARQVAAGCWLGTDFEKRRWEAAG